MFFEINLLCPQYKGRFAIVWIAATRGIKKLSRKQILEVSVGQICKDIGDMIITGSQRPKERLSLSLSAKLVNGTIKILNKQVLFLQENLSIFLTIPSTIILKPAAPSRKRGRKPAIILSRDIPSSEEIVPPIQPVGEHDITDKDVERALMEIPTAHIESITLRDEMPTRSIVRDDDNLFGDEGFMKTHVFQLDHGPSTVAKDVAEFEERMSRELSRIGSQDEGGIGLPPIPIQTSTRIDLDAITEVDLDRLLLEKKIKKKPVPEKISPLIEAIEEVPKIPREGEEDEPPKKKRKSERVANQNQNVQEEVKQTVVEADKEADQTPRLHTLFKALAPPILTNRTNLPKGFVNTALKFKRAKYRCPVGDYEIFKKSIETVNWDKFDDILEEFHDMAVTASEDISFGAARARSSSGSRLTTSLSRIVGRISQDTPTHPRPNRRDVKELTSEEAILSKEPSRSKRRKEISAQRSQTPEVEVPKLPLGASPSLAITLQEREPTILQTIIEDFPPAASAAKEPIVPVLSEIVPEILPEKEEKPKDTNARRRQIVRIVKKWDFEETILTIDDIAEKPLNRLNMSVAFGDLLNLHGLQYITLKKKEDSLELERIEKGPKLL